MVGKFLVRLWGWGVNRLWGQEGGRVNSLQEVEDNVEIFQCVGRFREDQKIGLVCFLSLGDRIG